jgi:hypothetical protein
MYETRKALIVDDEIVRRHRLAEAMSLLGWSSKIVHTSLDAVISLFPVDPCDRVELVFVPPRLRGAGMRPLLELISDARPDIQRIVVGCRSEPAQSPTRALAHAVLPEQWSLFDLVTATLRDSSRRVGEPGVPGLRASEPL